MNIETYEQTLLQGHTDEIISIGFQAEKKLLVAAQRTNERDGTYFTVWDLHCKDITKNEGLKIAAVASPQKSINQIAIDPTGEFVVTVGGTFDKMSIAVWNIQEVVSACKDEKISQPHVFIKGQIPAIEQQLGHILVHSIFVSPLDSGVSVYLGTDKGLKAYSVSFVQQTVVEKFVIGKDEELNNAISVAF